MSASPDREEQLGRLAEEVQIALAAGEELSAEQLAERFSVDEAEVVQLITALRLMQESLDEDLEPTDGLAAPELPDDYEIGQELGRGGMGIVYRAHQKSLDRDVAVKVLRPGDLQFGSAIARFENEARSLARLRHRHIVSVHEVGKASGFVYFTMDLIDGMSLQQLIAGGQMTNVRAVKLLRQVASAMTYAHGQGVVHRDLKPANILVDKDDDAFVVDFGLARDLGGSDNATMSGQMMGTPAYMSPEQALGDREKIGEAADIYALGAILYECLTGKRPFEGMPLVQLMHAVVHEEPTAPSKLNARVPKDLEVICQKAMQKRVEDRYATVLAMAEDLERFSIGREILARRQSRAKRLWRTAKRNRKPLLAVAVPVLVLLAFAWLFFVPSMLRERDIELGDRMAAQGNDAGAVIAYRSAIAAGDPDELDLHVRVRLARSLNNQAGKLLLSGAEDEQVQPLIDEVLALLGESHWLRHGATTFEEDNARYERLRVEALQGKFASMIHRADLDLTARTKKDLTGSSRDATLCLYAMWVATAGHAMLDEFGEAGCDAIVELLHKRQHLRQPIGNRFEGMVLSGTARNFFAHDHATYLERRLVELIGDEALPQGIRKDAAALFNTSDTLPFGRRFIQKSGSGWMAQMLVVDERDLGRIATAWNELQGLSDSEAYRRRTYFVGETLQRELRTAPNHPKPMDARLHRWLRTHTGHRFESPAKWQSWWAEHRRRDPREWLLEGLEWDIEPAALTPELLVARFRQDLPKNTDKHAMLHHLLAMTVGDDVQIPVLRDGFSTQVEWERMYMTTPDLRHPVRVATFAFMNGSPKPQLLWQTRRVLAVDEKFSWIKSVQVSEELADMHVGAPRRQWLNPAEGQLILRGSVKLGWRESGAFGSTHVTVQRRTATYQINGIYPTHDESELGIVSATDGSLQYLRNGQSYVDVVTLTLVEPMDAPDVEWQTSDWIAAANTSIHKARSNSITAMSIATMASFFPLPDQQVALRRMFRELNDQFDGKNRNHARAALLLAGDETAISLPEYDGTDRFATTHPNLSPSFWVRLVQTSTLPRIRDYASEQLQKKSLLPAFLRTLRAAQQTGLELPAKLAAEVGAAPSVAGAFFRLYWSSLAWLVAIVTTILAAAVVLLRARSVRTVRVCALIIWALSLAMASFTIWINGREWNTPWFGHGINVLATWILCGRIIPNWSWVIAPSVWTTITIAHLTGLLPRNEVMAYYGVGFALFIFLRCQHLAYNFRARRDAQIKRAEALRLP